MSIKSGVKGRGSDRWWEWRWWLWWGDMRRMRWTRTIESEQNEVDSDVFLYLWFICVYLHCGNCGNQNSVTMQK